MRDYGLAVGRSALCHGGRHLFQADLGDRRRDDAAAHDRVRNLFEDGTADDLLDLSHDVDPERDHIRGPASAPVTLVVYGDYECRYCRQAEIAVRALGEQFGNELRYVWRHLPLTDVHQNAQMAAEATEAAASQGAFWPMHDKLLVSQDELSEGDLRRDAQELGLDVERFWEEVRPVSTPSGWRTTSRPPTRAGSPARQASSSTAGAIKAHTTSRH